MATKYGDLIPAGPWNREKVRAYYRLWREDNRDLIRENQKKTTELNLESIRRSRRESQKRTRSREKDICRGKLNAAVQQGIIIRPEICSNCKTKPERRRDGLTTIQGHHHNGYENPLDVIWLCPLCHREAENAEKV